MHGSYIRDALQSAVCGCPFAHVCMQLIRDPGSQVPGGVTEGGATLPATLPGLGSSVELHATSSTASAHKPQLRKAQTMDPTS
jgi:hypothetical protein